ncbi:MAG: hypothetical protein VB035_04710 [Candidatus Fimivivens sp.]|nr:hypothetical protein [Candidatus Fimivivens sp.]
MFWGGVLKSVPLLFLFLSLDSTWDSDSISDSDSAPARAASCRRFLQLAAVCRNLRQIAADVGKRLFGDYSLVKVHICVHQNRQALFSGSSC